jgi:hypothetical protein
MISLKMLHCKQNWQRIAESGAKGKENARRDRRAGH